MSGVASRTRASILLLIFATLFSSAAVSFGAEITDSEAARGAAAEVLQLEQRVGAAIVNGDAAFYDRVTADDFVMTHSDRWTTGGKPLLVDDKASFRKRIENRSYVSMDFDSVRIEMHGDVAITYGRYVSNMRGVAPDRAWFSVWYEKVYARRNGQWIYLSHRTVHGATYGLTREAVANQ
jgi:hypothetical protein